MAVKWTKEQRQVIDLRDRNILVSAAAGSGKTAVLVERIISMITDERILWMWISCLLSHIQRQRQPNERRIAAAIEKKLEEFSGKSESGAAGIVNT